MTLGPSLRALQSFLRIDSRNEQDNNRALQRLLDPSNLRMSILAAHAITLVVKEATCIGLCSRIHSVQRIRFTDNKSTSKYAQARRPRRLPYKEKAAPGAFESVWPMRRRVGRPAPPPSALVRSTLADQRERLRKGVLSIGTEIGAREQADCYMYGGTPNCFGPLCPPLGMQTDLGPWRAQKCILGRL